MLFVAEDGYIRLIYIAEKVCGGRKCRAGKKEKDEDEKY